MKSRSAHRLHGIAAAVATVLGVPLAKADPPPAPAPDTSNWKCDLCPFFQGNTSNVEAGVLDASGANAAAGRYTGIDHDGAYADVSADGQLRDKSGQYLGYSADHLGLPSREGYLEGGQEGRYEIKVSYDDQPTRLYDTTVSPFLGPQAGVLALPGGWATAGSTAALTQLGSSLHPVDLGFDRRTVDLSGKYFLSTHWTLYADLEHQEKVGASLIGAAFLTQAVQLPEPINYQTDGFEAGAMWVNGIASARLSYSGSWFQDNTDSLTWANPFSPVVPDATEGRLALPPSNNLQQVAASGEVRLPVLIATTLTYNFSYGWLGQDAPFLPATTQPDSPALPANSLDGELHLTHYALGLSSRPLRRLYLRGTATYDGRDDRTAVLTIPQILTDTLAAGTAVTPRYSYDRTRLEGSADYRLTGWVRAGVGGTFESTHFGPGQLINWMQDERSYGEVTFTPLGDLSFTFKGGNASRRTGYYNTAVLPAFLAENPLLRAYDYAPRDTNFFDFLGSWSPLAALTWTVQGTWTDDAYRLSELGLQQARDRKIASTVTWSPQSPVSLYLEGSYQRLSALQSGNIGDGASSWYEQESQGFWDVGVGAHWAPARRWDVSVDYLYSLSRENDTTLVPAQPSELPEPFPENRYTLDSVTVNGTYQVSRPLKVRLWYRHERYDTSDWALDDVGPATVPTLLSLGAQPYRYTVNMVALTAQYAFGAAAPSGD